jgi:glycosyltransferase involved in cell wall biosynthesis
MILTDPIPGKGDLARFMTKRAAKKGEKIIQKAKCFDSFVVLTEGLAETIETNGRPYTIVECVCDDRQPPSTPSAGTEKIVLYAGALEEEFGILDTAKAFAEIPEAQFWVYGRGNAEKELKKLAEAHSNIRFFGFAAQETVAQARNVCDFLINPRRPTGTFTRYSFPSKTVEYILSAKPVIMYKLEGITDEFDAYLNYIYGQEMQEIADELKIIFARDYGALAEKAKKARSFVLENKNGKKQAEKIIALMK